MDSDRSSTRLSLALLMEVFRARQRAFSFLRKRCAGRSESRAGQRPPA